MRIPQKGDIALDDENCLGLVVNSYAERFGAGLRYVAQGIHLTDKKCPIGARWQCVNPRIVSNLSELSK